MGYTKAYIKGISWISAFRIVTRGFSLLKIIILARILSPSQFGLFGIATLTLALLELLTETGVNVFLIQSKKEIKEVLNSAWVVSIVRGCIIAVVMIIFSPLVSIFFKTPAATQLIIIMSLVPLIRGVINPAEVSFQRNLEFHYEFWFRSSIFIFDALIAVIVAFITHSVYSLVVGIIAGALLEAVLSFVLIKLRPKFSFNLEYIKEIIHKGKWVTAYGILNYLSMEGDNIVVGKIFGPSLLGIYEMAYNIAILPMSEISDVASRVAFPIFSKIEQERKRLMDGFKKTMLTVAIPSFFLSLFLFLFSKEIVTVALGQKWLSVIPILKLLSVYGFIRSINGPATALFLAIEKQKYVTIMNIAKVSGMFIVILPLAHAFGINGVIYAVLFSAVLEIPVVMYFLKKI